MCYIDDILVTGGSEEEHLRNLEEVLRRLQAHGIRMKRKKCFFMQDAVEYLGHLIDANGKRLTPENITAIKRAPMPTNVQQLRSFLGLLNYYRKFLPMGAIISHVFPNGEERPITFASRSLSKSEKNYSQIDKEALALVYGVQKFHTYLYGRHFTLITDHKPLTTILGPKKGVPAVAAAKLQRWALLLAAYNYTISNFDRQQPMETQTPSRDCLCPRKVLEHHPRLDCVTYGKSKLFQ